MEILELQVVRTVLIRQNLNNQKRQYNDGVVSGKEELLIFLMIVSIGLVSKT